MNGFSNRACRYLEDPPRVIDLLLDYRAATTVYTYPTVWRLRLLWSSRMWNPAEDARLWEDETGRVVGFALLWRRQRESPYLALEWVIHPTLATEALVDAMLAWAVARVQTITVEQAASGHSMPMRSICPCILMPPLNATVSNRFPLTSSSTTST
jgi:hypothetical protein